jgi:xanthine dehydrogenase accessory factor
LSDERLFAQLAATLDREAVVVASVLHTRGATPRKRGARMLIAAEHCAFSVGGGMAEARVIDAARRLLASANRHATVTIDLSGGAGSAGVCGGEMTLSLRNWRGEDDALRARSIAAALHAGAGVTLNGDDLGRDDACDSARPNARLLIVGGGHCGLALCQLARHLDYDLWLFDDRAEGAAAEPLADATWLYGDYHQLGNALDTEREVHAVLLNRDFHADIAALRVLATRPPAFISMMGSRRRINQVRDALPDLADVLAHLTAPAGLDIGAQTPHEIAVSILAQVIRDRYRV